MFTREIDQVEAKQMFKHDESLPRVVWHTPLLRRILAVVLMGAIALPAYDFIYVYPAFGKLMVKAVEQDAVIVTDAARRIQIINPAFTELTGFERDEVLGKTPAFLKSGRHDGRFYEQMNRALKEHKRWRGEIWNRRKDGNVFPGLLSISTIEGKDEGDESYVGIYTDLSKQKAAEEHYQNMAYHDSLTSLPNRTLFLDRLGKAIRADREPRKPVALFFLDLDGFKQVNDEMGHEVGDLVLREVANRLTNSVRQGDTVSRLGGDEFTLVVRGIDQRKTLERIAKDLVERVTGPIRLRNGDTTEVGVSIGVSRYPLDSRIIEDLLAKADSAMYEAKQAGGNRVVFYTAPTGFRETAAREFR